MFRLINSHLQAYSLQVNSQDAVHTLGFQCVYISEMFKAYHLPSPEDDYLLVETCSLHITLCNKNSCADIQISITITLVINRLGAQNLFYNEFIICLYMFRALCAHY